MEQYLAERENEIPDKPGIYSFYYCPFQKKRLGVYKDKILSEPGKQDVLRVIKKKLHIYDVISTKSRLDVNIDLFSSGGRKVNTYGGEIESLDFLDRSVWEISLEEACRLLNFLESASRLFRPLYCGMTFSQGLKTRYFQHKRDYEISDRETFGSRLRKSGVLWTDLAFSVTEVAHMNPTEEELRKMESILILNASPLLNRK